MHRVTGARPVVAGATAASVVWDQTKRESALAETTKFLWRLGRRDARQAGLAVLGLLAVLL
jgi:hypothetical protein